MYRFSTLLLASGLIFTSACRNKADDTGLGDGDITSSDDGDDTGPGGITDDTDTTTLPGDDGDTEDTSLTDTDSDTDPDTGDSDDTSGDTQDTGGGDTEDTGPDTGLYVDGDGDGFTPEEGDCDDLNPDISPDAVEACDGLDNDCNGEIDDAVGDLWFADVDGDGFGDPSDFLESCDGTSGYIADFADCDDTQEAVNPDADEVCDGIDNNCDGDIDGDALDAGDWFEDDDGDGYGDDGDSVSDCAQPEGYAADGGDCDDGDASVNPGAAEVCDGEDNDCNGAVDDDAADISTWYADLDEDNYGDPDNTVDACEEPEGYTDDSRDCDDSQSAVNPLALEVCDGVDNNCDGTIDEDTAYDVETFYIDDDSDGYGVSDLTVEACDAPEGYADNADDCDDTQSTVYPDADDVCDGLDNDCNGEIDDDATEDAIWYADADEDGFGDDGDTVESCEAPDGYVLSGGDCDDAADAVNPDADEICDGIDNNCDGTTDTDAVDLRVWYGDLDVDGYGDPGFTTEACDAPSGFVANADDCDDTPGDGTSINPDADEICDDVDNDCDGTVDVGASDESVWFRDADEDEYGDAADSVEACDAPDGYIADHASGLYDCDDADATINPDGLELCGDGVDNDCDASVDEDDAFDTVTWYADGDTDGYGDDGATLESCAQPDGYVDVAGDCDDSAAGINPDALETCDDVDEDCDSVIDEDPTDAATWYADADEDNYGDASSTLDACDEPEGYVGNDTDCDDAEGSVNPLAVELCDGIDNNCDGETDEDDAYDASTWYVDGDTDGYGDAASTTEACYLPDGYSSTDDDCDDTNGNVYPGAEEICDELDNDCDGEVDNNASDAFVWYADTDEDGFGDEDSSTTSATCEAPDGYVPDATDCDDGDGAVNTDATEVCNGIDDDCDAAVDDADGSLDDPDVSTWYADADEDEYGDAADSVEACDAPDGYITDHASGLYDCDDADAAVSPDGTEVCNNTDDDCDARIDEESSDALTFYADTDEDTYGDAASSTSACEAPDGFVDDATDCDDGDGGINPGAVEICDAIDQDCDLDIDEGALLTFYADVDEDTYGDDGDSVQACEAPDGYIEVDGDCDDADVDINPEISEICDYVDQDCDGTVDQTFKTGARYTDQNNCGACDNDCDAVVLDGAFSWCDSSALTPFCNYECEDGFVDLNVDGSDGCECEILEGEDIPFDGVDSDCDGIDGDPGLAVYVSTTGTPSGAGTSGDPLDSIQDAIDLASTDGYEYVLVAGGDYDEDVDLADGVNVVGSWDESFSLQDPAGTTSSIYSLGGLATVTAVGITADTAFNGFTVYGTSTSRGDASISLWLEDSGEGLVIANNTIVSGDARRGDDGGGGDPGGDGEYGIVGTDGELNTCSTLPDGGVGGVLTCADGDVDGGSGGDADCPIYNTSQPDGDVGLGVDPGTGGIGGCSGEITSSNCGTCTIVTGCWDGGTDGTDGFFGDIGVGGAGGDSADGVFASLSWSPSDGLDGVSGESGSGGGGGGVGAGAEVDGSCGDYHLGGTGGGGGSGGCGGESGVGGEGGGASLGIVYFCSGTCTDLPVITGNTIAAGDGGDGGYGGDGGEGGLGGLGALGGDSSGSAWCGLDGGNGGDGGDGGEGGAGGGGAGGASYAVYVVNVTPDASWVSADNALEYGAGGGGGLGGISGIFSATDGEDGADGADGEQNW